MFWISPTELPVTYPILMYHDSCMGGIMQGSHRPRYLLPPIHEVLHSTTRISESGRARKSGRAEEEGARHPGRCQQRRPDILLGDVNRGARAPGTAEREGGRGGAGSGLGGGLGGGRGFPQALLSSSQPWEQEKASLRGSSGRGGGRWQVAGGYEAEEDRG